MDAKILARCNECRYVGGQWGILEDTLAVDQCRYTCRDSLDLLKFQFGGTVDEGASTQRNEDYLMVFLPQAQELLDGLDLATSFNEKDLIKAEFLIARKA